MTETDQTTAHTTNGQSPWEAQQDAARDDAPERPELLVGAALLGGMVLARLLKRLGGGR